MVTVTYRAPVADGAAEGEAPVGQALDARQRRGTGVLPGARRPHPADEAPLGHGQAWLLDPEAFHTRLADLAAGPRGAIDRLRLREAATTCWDSRDPVVRAYVATLDVHTPEEWTTGTDDGFLAEWYRVLMADHLVPARALRSPAAIKDRLPELGWPRPDARRLAWGRELATLAGRYAPEHLALSLGRVLPVGNKGWLSQEDAHQFLARFRAMPRGAFRDRQHLIPLAEDAFAVLAAMVAEPTRVLVIRPGR